MKTNENFFDEASSFYNEMINFDKALINREKVLKNFINDKMITAADIGCGTGLDSISLARAGLKVTAFDLSEKMIELAANKAGELKLNINFVKSSADRIADEYHNSFSLVVSLGNTLANLNYIQLKKTIKNCYDLLTEGGTLLIQVLNFSRILKNKERIVNITHTGNYYYTRFYDFPDENIIFNILRFNAENPDDRDLISTTLYSHDYFSFEEQLKLTGFSEIKFWENFNRKLFEPETSKDLFIEAFK